MFLVSFSISLNLPTSQHELLLIVFVNHNRAYSILVHVVSACRGCCVRMCVVVVRFRAKPE